MRGPGAAMGSAVSPRQYPQYHAHLQGLAVELAKAAPGPMAGFAQLRKQATADGVLSRKVKELIALAVAVTTHCDGCVAYHTHDAVRAGATKEEIAEAIGVAVMMGGGPALVTGAEALEAASQFLAAPAGEVPSGS